MELKVWLLYLATEVIIAITPGPAIILVSSQGLKYGTKSSTYGSLGISSGNFLYFFLSAIGVGALILAAGNLFHYIKLSGAIYLMISGIIILYKSFKSIEVKQSTTVQQQSITKSYIQGLITQTANPKAIVFFVALIPLFIDETKNMFLQFAILGLTTITIETFILIGYGWLAARGREKLAKNKLLNKWQERLSGIALLGLGINLIFAKFGTD